jgi:hypothetical protein
MKKLVSLSLCLSLSLFTMARAMKPGQTLAAVAKTAEQKPTGEKVEAKTLFDDANKALAAMIKAARADNLSKGEEEVVAAEEDTDEEVASDDDSMEDASDDEGEDMSDDDSGGDEGDDDNGGDDGGDDGGD